MKFLHSIFENCLKKSNEVGGERQPGCMVEQQAQLATRRGCIACPPYFNGLLRTSGQLDPK